MGYYSDVGIAMYKRDFDEMIRSAAERNIDLSDLFGYGSASIHKAFWPDDSRNDVVTAHWESIKWYTDFENVRFIMSYIEDVPSLFIRLGEDADDAEILYGAGDESYDFDRYLYQIREVFVENGQEQIGEEDILTIAHTDGSELGELDAAPIDELLSPAT